MRIEAEFVDGVVTREPLAEESGYGGDALSQLVERYLCRPGGRCTPVLVDFADDGGELFGRRTTVRFGE